MRAYMGEPWSPEEDEIVLSRYQADGCAGVLALLPTRTRSAVYGRAKVLGVAPTMENRRPKGGYFTEDEDRIIREQFPGQGLKATAQTLGRTQCEVKIRARTLGVIKEVWFKQLKPGDVFDRLTLVEEVPRDAAPTRRPHWICLCECGNTCIAEVYALRRKATRSCGCLHRELSSVRLAAWTQVQPSATFESFAQVLFDAYTRGAVRRGISFELTFNQFVKLINSNCFFCGRPPAQRISSYPFVYNGIDRKNNELWYREENSLPACKTCNMGKGDTPFVEYMAWRDGMVSHVLAEREAAVSCFSDFPAQEIRPDLEILRKQPYLNRS